MLPEALFDLPRWLVLGVALGLLCSVGAAVAFFVGDRLFPTPGRAAAPRGEPRRHAEIRAYLDAIGEPYAEDHPVAGGTVEFYLPERDVAITFDARTFYVVERTDTEAVLVEHELPGVKLGSRLPFETPKVDLGGGPRRSAPGADGGRPPGRVSGPSVEPVDPAFAVLGVSAGATAAEVKRAYREKVKDVHPDLGGDADEFRRVREAYTTARNHARGRQRSERQADAAD